MQPQACHQSPYNRRATMQPQACHQSRYNRRATMQPKARYNAATSVPSEPLQCSHGHVTMQPQACHQSRYNRRAINAATGVLQCSHKRVIRAATTGALSMQPQACHKSRYNRHAINAATTSVPPEPLQLACHQCRNDAWCEQALGSRPYVQQ